ncbi:MAG: PEP-CTERM sorting domain-containing protein [Methylococcaceae bacterium]|nr:PEP-CTERM sorting domain-containing protein [Methylococcaceae bacterium]
MLWYTYADPLSEYRGGLFGTLGIPGIAAAAGRYPESSGLPWNLSFFDDNSPMPNFSAYNVLVIESGEAFRTQPPSGAYATPGYTGTVFSSNPPGLAVSLATSAFVDTPTAAVPEPTVTALLFAGILPMGVLFGSRQRTLRGKAE